MPSSRGPDQVPVHFYVHKTVKADFAEAVRRNGDTMTDVLTKYMREYPDSPAYDLQRLVKPEETP